uniref:ATP synthase F0 subunit 8 n=1 Tax=Acrobeloides nanus TaxID=290746 RepID=A0A914CZT5_9BILA
MKSTDLLKMTLILKLMKPLLMIWMMMKQAEKLEKQLHLSRKKVAVDYWKKEKQTNIPLCSKHSTIISMGRTSR